MERLTLRNSFMASSMFLSPTLTLWSRKLGNIYLVPILERSQCLLITQSSLLIIEMIHVLAIVALIPEKHVSIVGMRIT